MPSKQAEPPAPSLGQEMEGVVKRFNIVKGYGFITVTNLGEPIDVYVHYSAIIVEGFKKLKVGQRVQFHIRQTPKGLQATHVRPAG